MTDRCNQSGAVMIPIAAKSILPSRRSKPSALALALLVLSQQCLTILAQERVHKTARLIRVDGLSGVELPAGPAAQTLGPGDPLVELVKVSIDAERLTVNRLRTKLILLNRDPERVVREAGWQLDVYDESLRLLSRRIYLYDRVSIEPRSRGSASARLAAILPDRMLVLVQLVRVEFSDGSEWTSPVECKLADDLSTIACKERKPGT